jgi:hypothetical protein
VDTMIQRAGYILMRHLSRDWYYSSSSSCGAHVLHEQVLNLCDLLDSVFGGLFYEAGYSPCHSVDFSMSILCFLGQQAERKARTHEQSVERVSCFEKYLTRSDRLHLLDMDYLHRYLLDRFILYRICSSAFRRETL